MKTDHKITFAIPISIVVVGLIAALIIPNLLKRKEGCEETTMFLSRKGKVKIILSRLSSSNPDVVKKAKNELYDFKFKDKDLKLIYSAIEKKYQDDIDEFMSTRANLIRVLWDVHDVSTVGFIEDIYPSLPPNKDIVFSALRTLTEIKTAKSLSLLSHILLESKPDFGNSIYKLFVPIMKQGEYLDSILPAIFKLIRQDYYKDELYSFIANWLSNGAIDREAIVDIEKSAISDFAEALRKSQEASSSDENAVKNDLGVLEMTADLLGYLTDKEKTIPLLRQGLQHFEARIQLYCAISLIRLDEQVSDKYFKRIAKDPLLRLMLYEALDGMDKPELFPDAFMTQQHFAESDMVTWLTFPTEFGRPPDKIELLETMEIIDSSGEAGRLYMYKYFYEDDEDRWMVGISGPQPSDKNKIKTSGHMTFSHWNKLDQMSIDEHFKSFIEDSSLKR